MKKVISVMLILSCLLTMLPVFATASSQETKSRGGKLIALTFDDGPAAYTKRLLDGLAQRDVTVSFFLLGQCVEYYPNTVRRAFNEGHEIAQHTYNHPTLTTQTDDQVRWQVQHTDGILDTCLGMDLDYLLRPPYGDCNSRVLSLIDCPAVMWSLDSLDWQLLNAYKVRDRIVAQAFDGAIILAHDIHSTTVDGALMAIDILLEQGYEFVTVSELYRRRGVEMEDGLRYYSCKNNGTDLGPILPPVITAEPVYGGYKIKMSSESGTKIYYSTDGSAPVTEYTEEFVLTSGQELKAFACYEINRGRSETVTKTVASINLESLTLSSRDGKFFIDNPNENVDVRYTTDGSVPTGKSPLYQDGIDWFDGTLTYCAMGYGVGSEAASYYVSHNGNVFLDVAPDQWYFDEMDWAVTQGLLKGTEPYYYEPETSLTRAMFVTILYRLMEQQGYDVSVTDNADFSDVAAGSWYEEAVSWSSSRGIVLGYENGTFRPDVKITREEMCVILDRLLTELEQPMPESEPEFSDNFRISLWAYDAVGKLSAGGIILGMGNNCFAPQNTATRAEAATVLLRLFNAITK